MQVVLKPNMCE